MNSPDVTVVLDEVETHLTQALALIDRHKLATAAAPHIDLGLHYVRIELADVSLPSAGRSAD